MVWRMRPASTSPETVQDAILTPFPIEVSFATSSTNAEGVPETLAANPWQVEQGQTPEAKALEDAIRSGDRYRVASALASMGVNIDDELLSHILLPPFGDEPAKL